MSNLDLINVRETLEQQVEPFKAALVEQYFSWVEFTQESIQREGDKTEGSSRWFDGRLVRGTYRGQYVSRGSARVQFEKFGHGLEIVCEEFEHGQLDEIHRADSKRTVEIMSDFNPHVSEYEQADRWSRSSILKQQQRFDGFVNELFNVERTIVEECYDFAACVYSPKTRDEMLDKAKQYADDVWSKWLGKMVDKLEKMNVTSIEVSGDNPLDNTLVVGSVHGVSFDLKNSIVIKWSNQCGYFNQFPARFTNVRNHGDKVKGLAKQEALANYIEKEVELGRTRRVSSVHEDGPYKGCLRRDANYTVTVGNA